MLRNKLFLVFTILICLLAQTRVCGQEASGSWAKKLQNLQLEPVAALQLWSSYTIGTEIYDADSDSYLPVEDRFNFSIRRTRLGIKGQPYENLRFNITASIDWVGNDLLSGTEGGVNNGASPAVGLWHAYVQWKMIKDNEALNLTGGYIPPQIGRESITSALRSTSMEKSWSQNYLRRHLAGTGPGRAPGVNLGGLFLGDEGKHGFSYDIGLFHPVYPAFSGNSTGIRDAPLLTGRLVAYIGDPESATYTTGHKVNYFGKRQGLSLAVAGATQGETALFLGNHAAGVDLLLNIGQWNLDGEWTYMWREGSLDGGTGTRDFTITSHTGYIRLSYNIMLSDEMVLEPVAMLMQFNGESGKTDLANAASVDSPAGKEQKVDVGVNFYLNPDLKLSLHYTARTGEDGMAGPGATVNNYFFQNGVGAIRRGDWIGLGMVAVF